MHGYAAVAALIFAIPAMLLWIYEKFPRPSAWCFCITAIAVAVAFPQWLDAAAGLTYSRTGLAALGGFTVITGFCFGIEAFGSPQFRRLRKAFKRDGGTGPKPRQRYHRIRTPAFSIAFGSALVLAVGSLGRLVTGAGQSLTQTTSLASAAVAQIRSGQAARAVPHADQLPHVAIGVVIFVVLVAVLMHIERRKGRLGGRRGAGRPGIGGGGGGKSQLPGRINPAELSGRH